jgi:hypothetical protein
VELLVVQIVVLVEPFVSQFVVVLVDQQQLHLVVQLGGS